MQLINRLENKYNQSGINNLTYYLIAGQVLAYVIILIRPELRAAYILQGDLLLQGEWWRIFTFLFQPFADSPLWAALTWYIYYMYGSALEREWGAFRYTFYLLIAVIATVIASLLYPQQFFTNQYIFGSLFLAFAQLFPDYQLYIFFVLPVKVKWLAWIMWFSLGLTILTGPATARILALISVSNFLLFFRNDVLNSFITYRRQADRTVKKVSIDSSNPMVCAQCKATVADDKIFYYCDECKPESYYCDDHIKGHTHKNKKK